jgi:hypothetical protein
MLFSIPLSEQEIITDTPLSVKSLRSFHFVAKKSSWMYLNDDSFMPVVSIVVDGKVIANKLPILPFLLQKGAEAQYIIPTVDSRLVEIPVAINVNCSEIRVRTEGVEENSFELVFGCAETPVLEEEFTTYFDSVNLFDVSHDHNVQLTESAERIFVAPYKFEQEYGWSPEQYEYVPTGRTLILNANAENPCLGELRVGSKDEYMPDMSIDLLTPSLLQSWKNASYTFSRPTTKNVTLSFSEESQYDEIHCLTVFFISKKIFQ